MEGFLMIDQRDLPRTPELAGSIIENIIDLMSLEEIASAWDYERSDLSGWDLSFAEQLSTLAASDDRGASYAAQVVNAMLARGAALSSAGRRQADKIVKMLANQLPHDELCHVAIRLLEHTRKNQRQLGVKLLRWHPECEAGGALMNFYRKYGDDYAVFALTRGRMPSEEAAQWLLQNLEERVHRAWVFECLIRDNLEMARKLADMDRLAFVWGAGRSQSVDATPDVMEFLADEPNDSENVSLFVWALGVLGARNELIGLARQYDCDSKISLPDLSST
jgi:hypothetical protein